MRQRLFAWSHRRLLTGRVYHFPYQLGQAVVSSVHKGLFELDGLSAPPGSPDSVLYSPGVDVTIYPPTPVR